MSARTFAVGDIHGCSRTFVQLVQKMGLKKEDTLFLLGDYVDRGPDTRGVIEIILDMQRDGYDVRPIRGNHEEMLLQAVQSRGGNGSSLWVEFGGLATLRSYGVKRPGDLPAEHLEFLRALPLYRLTDAFVFVHAGLDCTLSDPFAAEGETAMLWARPHTVDAQKLGGRRVVVGHTPFPLEEIEESLRTDLIRLDNGCVFENGYRGLGNLVALDTESMELILQKNIDRVG